MKRDFPMTHVPARAIDVGYANTKYTCGRDDTDGSSIQVGMFPSVAATLLPGATFLHKPGTLGANGCVSEIDGVPYFVGKGVQMHLRGMHSRHVMKDFSKSPQHLALVHGAMHYMLEAEGNPKELSIEHLTLGLPLNTFDTHREHLRDRVIGRHAITSPDPDVGVRHVTVHEASVIVQPLGAMYNYGMNHPTFDMEGWNLVIDVGGGTVDFLAAFDKHPNYARSGAHPEAMLACSFAVANAIKQDLQSQFGVVQTIDTAIREHRATVRIAGEHYEMARYKGVITDVFRRGYDAMLNTVGAVEDFQSILLCGGGGSVFHDFLCEHHPEIRKRVCLDEGAAYSNVRGFQVVAEFMQQESSSSI
jgi:plasmid segregation protein ParM